ASGGTPSKANSEFWGGEIPWVSFKDMYVDYVDDSIDRVTELGSMNGTRLVRAGTILMAVRGMGLANYLPIAKTRTRVAFNQDIKALSISADDVLQDYLFAALRGFRENIRELADEAAHGTKRLQTDRLEDFVIPIPPISIQRQIIDVMTAFDDLIELNKQRVKTLEEMARVTFDEWFTYYRFPGGNGSKPTGWSESSVRPLILRIRAGCIYRKGDVLHDGAVPVIDQSTAEVLGFHDNQADHVATPTNPLVIFGDHTCKMQLMLSEFSVGPNTVVFKSATKHPLKFLYFLIQGLVETREYKRHWNDFMDKRITLPSLDVADQFDKFVSPIFMLLDQLKLQNANLRAQRDLLLPRLVSGQIDVSETNAILYDQTEVAAE
ncbi:MAG: restriction endonuclease subunit S, partial [Pseudomonadota bacterium]